MKNTRKDERKIQHKKNIIHNKRKKSFSFFLYIFPAMKCKLSCCCKLLFKEWNGKIKLHQEKNLCMANKQFSLQFSLLSAPTTFFVLFSYFIFF